MTEPQTDAPLLRIRDLHLAMRSFDGEAHVLNGVALEVRRGEIWGLVGETGSGKSLTGLSVSRLVPSPPARYLRGTIAFRGRDVLAMPEDRLRALRGRSIGMIFQDPTTNLNPLFTVGAQLVDVALHAAKDSPDILEGFAAGRSRRRAARAAAIAMLDRVGIRDAAARIDDYPHQFSGGMRQRVLIAMALIGRPDLLIADEPTTALDVSVQAQILRLIYDMVRERGLGVLFITHNLGVVAELCSHVAVMYAGNIVEAGPVSGVLKSPAHPYTRGLLQAVPTPATRPGALRGLAGAPPDLLHPPEGCRFAPRCTLAGAECRQGPPPMRSVEPFHEAACVRVGAAREAA
jgi:oligopeptide/dipeptide ABC transporter ATP-binding protein